MKMEEHTLISQDPLAFAVVSATDDIELLENLSIDAVPPSLGSSQSDSTVAVEYSCTLILPMDRVPIVLSIPDAPTCLTYMVKWTSQQQYVARTSQEESLVDDVTTRRGQRGGALTARTTLHHAPSNFRYKHEITTARQVIAVSAIRAVWSRRYLLLPVALEILLESGESHFFAFETEAERILVQEKIVRLAKQKNLDRTLEQTEAKRDKWRSWWCEGRVSNFKYLMYLNFMAGRSYGDTRQYPVFPHIVADYLSSTLDLSNGQTFRNLEKPMGAQTPERENVALNIFNELSDHPSELRHYSMNYAAPLVLFHYMIRVQPFADYFLHMNSKMDETDRVFDSLHNVYVGSFSSCKETIPEFFCFPTFLRNDNRFSFGTKQDGTVVNSVVLPAWCEDERDCILQLREALECRYVSERLCKWIDLIFGYKQQGKEAIAAINVFHPTAYRNPRERGETDPNVIEAAEVRIQMFGQIPLQLFNNPHKARVKSTNTDWLPSPCPSLRFEASTSKGNVLLFPGKVASPIQQAVISFSDYGPSGWISFCRTPAQNAGADEFGMGDFFSLGRSQQTYCFPSNVFPLMIEKDTPKELIVLGEHSITLVDLTRDNKEVAVLTFHAFTISCCAVVSPSQLYVGTTCGAIVVVEVSWTDEMKEVDLQYSPSTNGKESGMALINFDVVKTVRGRTATLHWLDTLHGHQGTILSLVVSMEWGIAVSTSADMTVAVWDVHRRILIRTIVHDWSLRQGGTLLRHSMCHPPRFFPELVSVNPKRGDIAVAGSIVSLNLREQTEVHLYSINGERCGAPCVMRSPVTALLAVGPIVFVAEGRTVVLLQSTNLRRRPELLHHSDIIVSLSLSPTGNVLAALDDKGVVVHWKVEERENARSKNK